MVTVVIPVYNLENYVAETLRSVSRQTFRDFEAVIIDDGSTDRSAEVVAQTIAGDDRFTLLKQQNAGSARARKAGIEMASGRYIAFLDGDDYIEPDFLERLTEAADDTLYDIIRCNGYIRVAPDYKTAIKWQLPETESGYQYITEMLCGRETACLWDKLYARRLFVEQNLKHYATKTGQDMLLNLEIACRNTRMLNIDYIGYNYVQRRGSAVHNRFSLEQCREIVSAVEEIFRDNPEAAQEVNGELLCTLRGVWQYCRYIEKSRNRWAGDEPFVKALRVKAHRHSAALRRNLSFADRMMFTLDRFRVLRPLVLAASTLRRWSTSISRRWPKLKKA